MYFSLISRSIRIVISFLYNPLSVRFFFVFISDLRSSIYVFIIWVEKQKIADTRHQPRTLPVLDVGYSFASPDELWFSIARAFISLGCIGLTRPFLWTTAKLMWFLDFCKLPLMILQVDLLHSYVHISHAKTLDHKWC